MRAAPDEAHCRASGQSRAPAAQPGNGRNLRRYEGRRLSRRWDLTLRLTRYGPPPGRTATRRRRGVSAAGRRAARPSGALARIELDDQLLVDGDFDLVPAGESENLTAHVRHIERQPGRHCLADEALLNYLEILKLPRLLHHGYRVARLD